MQTVVGPINQEDWYTMRMVHSSIRYMRQRDPVFYADAIDKETDIYKELKSQYV